MTNWHGYGTTIFGTWNVRGLNGKEHELTKEIKQTKVKYLALTETKRKAKVLKRLKIIYWSIVEYQGVKEQEQEWHV